ncbi:MAG TPA: chlorite dismutase family protein [Pyrinomonadaceae bacterium]|jgi:chlorite dismutase|nr:chlorite dismutase family protein [Pyrinomonadaceae bacterium]
MSSNDKEQTGANRGSLRLAERGERVDERERVEEQQVKAPLPRQFVTFTFWRARPEWRMLGEAEKAEAKREFIRVVEAYHPSLLIHSYSIVGLRSNVDFMLWRIGYSLDPLQEMSASLNRTMMGRYLEVTQSFLSMTKRSMYIDKDNPEHVEDRLHIVPGQSKYLFVYPFVKTRNWYTLSVEERQGMMDDHIRVGSKYRSVKLHTTYSFGLDDQEFVVAFETENPADFLDLVQELRETKASSFTLRDTPMYTCRQQTLAECLDALG